MAISRDEVLKVARLARLDLADDEVARLTDELGAILDAVSKVSELDLSDVPPTSHPLDLVNAWAEDEPHESLPLEDVLRNAPWPRGLCSGCRRRHEGGSRSGDWPRRGLSPVALTGVSPLRGQTPGQTPVSVVDTLRLTAEDAIALVERGDVSSAELHGVYLDAIAARDGELHAFLRTVEHDGATGIPIALKDVISTRGVETTAGSRMLEHYVPVFDATVTSRCRAAGLSLLGKTNTDEFAMGSSTENSAFGPSRNPWDPERVPGGSGGGTAAAVSAGLAPWGLGSDTGGSIKQPSALCGNVGLRPTYGTVSRYGIVAFASSLDQVGPVAKTVRDVALLYRIVSGRDPADSTTVELPGARASSRPRSGWTASGSACRARRWRSRQSRPASARRSKRRSRSPRSSAPRSTSATYRSRSTTACPATT